MARILSFQQFIPLWGAMLASSCMRGQGFMEQRATINARQALAPIDSSTPEISIEILATTIQGESASGLVSADSPAIQLLQAAENSSIAGTTAEFPPGTLAIATEITIEPGASIAHSTAATNLNLSSEVAATAPAVQVTAATAQDTAQAFTVSLLLPDETALRLQDNRGGYERLVVLYRVQSVTDNTEKTGYVGRASLEIKDNLVRFKTRHFGTFQAILTRTVLPEPTKALITPAVLAKPSRNVWFVPGSTGVVFANDAERGAGIQGWILGYTPATVSNFERGLQTTAIAQKSKEP